MENIAPQFLISAKLFRLETGAECLEIPGNRVVRYKV
jgi:hypothetical protein